MSRSKGGPREGQNMDGEFARAKGGREKKTYVYSDLFRVPHK